MTLLLAISCFSAAALGGLFLALRIHTRKSAPLAVAVLHGGAGAAGLGALVLAVLSTQAPGGQLLALAILGLNSLLGLFLFSRHVLRRPWPGVLMALHGAFALIGLTILILAYLEGG